MDILAFFSGTAEHEKNFILPGFRLTLKQDKPLSFNKYGMRLTEFWSAVFTEFRS